MYGLTMHDECRLGLSSTIELNTSKVAFFGDLYPQANVLSYCSCKCSVRALSCPAVGEFKHAQTEGRRQGQCVRTDDGVSTPNHFNRLSIQPEAI